MIKEGKSLRTMQLDDIAAAGISPDLPKWYYEWLFESLKSVITYAVEADANGITLNKKDLLKRSVINTIVNAGLTKYNAQTKSFFGNEGDFASELSNMYFFFITNSLVYEFFESKN